MKELHSSRINTGLACGCLNRRYRRSNRSRDFAVNLNPSRITAAVPVTSVEGRRVVEAIADDLIYLAAPEPFGNAGVWYRDFSRPADDSISQHLSA
ncbi:MAG: hypothetical protein ACR2LM_19590 [Pyrinomonadaceae bacterium]